MRQNIRKPGWDSSMKEDEVFMRNERDELRAVRDAIDALPESAEKYATKALASIVDDILVHIVYKLARHRLMGQEVWE